MTPSPHTPRRILVVDDDDVKRYTIVHPLRGLGLEIDEATSAAEALRLAKDDPELIILDVKLPDGSGFEVCEKLKADPATASIPVLYVSAHFRTSEDRVRGLRGGADGYLVAPISRDELIASVEVWLRARAAERDRHRLLLALDRERAFLEQVIDQLPVGVLIADAPGGRLLFANTVAKALFGPAVEDVGSTAGYTAYAMAGADGETLRAEDYPLARALAGHDVRAFETREVRADGGLRVLSNNASAVRDTSGQIVGAVVVFEDVSVRRRDEEQLRVVGQLREELIGILGHDLRNPVQAIKMSLRLLESSALPYRQQNAVTRIHNSTERMRRMIDDMVDFASSRLGGRIQIRAAQVDLGEVVTEVIDELRTVHPNRSIVREGAGASGRWDPDRLAQVASNLIGNALQYSPPEATVTVRVSETPAHATLEVHNRGKAIPQKDLTGLFAPFRRAANADEKDVGGRSVGLGLYITRQIVTAHGGTISVRSNEEEGTTFRVELPHTSG